MSVVLENALLVFEAPWYTPKVDPVRLSMLPFIKSLEQLNGNFRAYYATFYDAPGFKTALDSDLRHTQEKRQIVYIAAHGSRSKIADGRASLILSNIGELAPRVRGVIVGSCEVAQRSTALDPALCGNVRWAFGYQCEVDWFTSSLIDIAIINEVCGAGLDADFDSDTLVNMFALALGRFSFSFPISEDVSIFEAIRLIHRPKHARKPVDLTEELIARAWPTSSREFGT